MRQTTGRSLVAALGQHKVEATTHDRLDITWLNNVREAITAFAPDLVNLRDEQYLRLKILTCMLSEI